MREDFKKLVLFFSATMGFLQEDENFKGYGYEVARQELHDHCGRLFDKIIKRVPEHDRDVTGLINKIKSKKIYFDMITDTEIKRRYKEPITISRKNRDIIAEHALEYKCSDCNRNKKRCGLRTALAECDVPLFHDDPSKCPYDMK